MKIAFIVPYFGKFPSTFNITLNSISFNSNITWIFFTDDKTEYNYPKNAEVHYMSFEDTKSIIQSKFDFKISLEKPYKLCDYKPAYGYIFSEYIKDFDYWGHCDIDVIFGDVSIFINEKMNMYDKIGLLGHMELYRNNEDVNKRFMLPDSNNKLYYKKVFSSSDSFLFDEPSNGRYNIATLWKDYNFPLYNDDSCIADIAQKSSFFQICWHKYDFTPENIDKQFVSVIDPRKKQLFWWDNGHLFLSYKKDGKYQVQEFAYIHLIRRMNTMKIRMTSDCNLYKIIPHSFISLEEPITKYNIDTIKWIEPNLFYFSIRFKNLKCKIQKKMKRKNI